MSTAVFVIDTSYLLELFSVPGYSTKKAVEEIKNRFEKAFENKSRLYVPLPCIYELANHIADVPDGEIRKKLAQIIYDTVQTSVETNNPWNITPSTGLENLPDLLKKYTEEFVIQQISLTDTSVIQEAKRLKKKYSDSRYTVHIWTKDKTQKAFEPDIEINPFLG